MSLLREPLTGSEQALAPILVPILIFNVQSHCNCRCVMCDIWKRTTREQIDRAELEPHREAMHRLGVRQVVLSGGEPLLHNDLESLCGFFRQANIGLTLLTTGLLLQKRAREVVEWFDEVIVSIDGPAEVHDTVRRVPGAFALIGDGVAALRALRPGIRITCRTTVQKANHNHLCATARAVRQIGFDAISLLAADLTSGAFNRPLVWPGERQDAIALTVSEIAVLEEQIDGLLQMPEFVTEGAEKLQRILRHFRAHLGLLEPEAPLCNAPWVSAVIETDGSLRPCFFHPPVGNLRSAALDEVINGERARRFRQDLDVKHNPICRRCVCSLNLQAPSP